MLSFALVFQSVPPILNLIISDFGLSYAQAGLLMSLFALPGVLVAIPSGIISDRFGVKRVGAASLVLMITGTLVFGVGNSFLYVCAGRVISGVGALTLAIVLPQLLSRWFGGKELGIGMGVFNTAMPLGTIASFNVLSAVGKSLGWRAPVLSITAVGIMAFLMFLWLFKEPPLGAKETGTGRLSGIIEVGIPVWLVGLAWMWFNSAFISFLTFSSGFFAAKDYEVGFAGFMSSIVMMGSLFLSPAVGYLVHRFGREETLIALGGFSLSSLLLFVPTAPFTIPLLVLMAISAALVPTPIFSLPSKLVKPENLGLGFGIFTVCQNAGVLMGPYLTGLAKDLTGEYVGSFYLMSLFAALQAVTALILHFARTKVRQRD